MQRFSHGRLLDSIEQVAYIDATIPPRLHPDLHHRLEVLLIVPCRSETNRKTHLKFSDARDATYRVSGCQTRTTQVVWRLAG
eukprot:6468650-Amphidinium_carterae.1